MRHVSETLHQDLEALYIQIGWPLYKKYIHAYDALKGALTEPEKVFEGFNLSPELLEALMKNIKRRLAPQPVKVRADVEVTCYRYEGIDAIKSALLKAEATSTKEAPIKVKLVAPPLYVVETTAVQKDSGIKALHIAIEAIQQDIEKFKGECSIKVEPRTVYERDERELASLFDKLAREKIDGDEEGDEEGNDEEGDDISGGPLDNGSNVEEESV